MVETKEEIGEVTRIMDLESFDKCKTTELESVMLFYKGGEYDFRRVGKNGLLESVDFDESFYSFLARKYVKEKKDKNKIFNIGGVIPKELLYASSINRHTHKIIWRFRSQKKELRWTDKYKENDGIYYFPDMIFGFINNRLHMILDDGNNNYYVPNFSNTGWGTMCTGNVDLKFNDNMTWKEVIGLGEAAFFETFFSHPAKGTMFEYMKFENNKFDAVKYSNIWQRKIPKSDWKKQELLCWA